MITPRARARARARAGIRLRARCATVAWIAVVALSCVPAAAAASPGAAQKLIDTYSPIVMMRAQHRDVCNTSEEQYAPPTSVDVVLGNPRVRLLKFASRATRLVKRAPRASDLAGRGREYYLDLPGDPLDPGCKFARDYAALRRAGHAPAVTYAHIAREAGVPGLAVQYWFFYYFNEFNDLHEGDWEGMQITFDAATPAAALSVQPDEIVLFQHGGGEHADWTDAKVQTQGRHPIVYSAAGSHATFYGSSLWLGNGQNGAGVGCDNTTPPLTAIRPQPILLPDTPVKTGRFAWLSYTGRWGQREAGFNNGPTGPNTKTVWRVPFTWMDGTRSASARVPEGSLFGPSVASVFCGSVAQVSGFLNLAAKTAPGALAIALVIALLIFVPIRLTRWRPVELEPLRKPRALGQLLLASGRLYWRHFAALVLIALTSVAIIAGVNYVEFLLRRALGTSGSAASVVDSGPGLAISTTASIARSIASPIGSAAVIAFVCSLERDQDLSYGATWRAVGGRLWRVIAVQLLILILLIGLAATIIGIPFAVRKFVDWQFAQQEVMFESRSIRESLRGSTRIVRGHWWHAAAAVALLWLISQIPGPPLGFALLLTNVSPGMLNLIGSLVFMLLFSYVGVGRTLLYLDLAARERSEPRLANAIGDPVRRLTRMPLRPIRARS